MNDNNYPINNTLIIISFSKLDGKGKNENKVDTGEKGQIIYIMQFPMFDLNQVYLHRKSFPPQNNNEILIIPQNDHSVTWFVHEFYNITWIYVTSFIIMPYILAYKKKTDNLDVLLKICWRGRQHGEETKHI